MIFIENGIIYDETKAEFLLEYRFHGRELSFPTTEIWRVYKTPKGRFFKVKWNGTSGKALTLNDLSFILSTYPGGLEVAKTLAEFEEA